MSGKQSARGGRKRRSAAPASRGSSGTKKTPRSKKSGASKKRATKKRRDAGASAASRTKRGNHPVTTTASAGLPVVQVFEASHQALPAHATGFVRERAADDVAGLRREQLHEVYRYMFETRRLEEHLVALYRQSKVIGGVYRSLGQEGVAVGCAYALRDGDFLQPLIRDLGALLVHGVSPLAVLRQYMAKVTGPSGGRDLNTHFSDPAVGILGPVSMLGAMIPPLCGCLIAAGLRGERKVGLAFIGDGGSSTGAFYEGVNFAAVRQLPLIVVIEANHYAYSTPTTTQVPDGDLVRRARGFGCTVAHVDGNDVLACYEATRAARARGLAGDGPTIIVADTYRRKGHAEHDNQKYVPGGEIDDWAEHNDPLARYEQFLLRGGHARPADLATHRTEVEARLDADRDQAVDESLPDPSTQTQGVFADGTQPWPPSSSWFRGGPEHRA